MEPETDPERPRRWPQVLLGIGAVGVLAAAVVFAVTSDGRSVTTGDAGATTTTTVRACVQPPPGESPAPPVDVAADPTTTTSPTTDRPPDGTYLATLSTTAGTREVSLTILVPGGRTYEGVMLADGVAVPSQQIGGAVTVDAGTVTAVDTGRVSWDDDLGRGDDSCLPRTGCVLTDDPVPHAWPGGIDGELGTDIRTVPDALSTILAKWGVDVDPLAITLVARPCVLGAAIGATQLRMDIELTDDGYVLAGMSSDAPDAGTAFAYTAQDDVVSIPLPEDLRTRFPEATVSVAVRFGDKAVKASVPATSESVDVTVDRRMADRGSIVLTWIDPAGTLQRLVAVQVPAGNSTEG